MPKAGKRRFPRSWANANNSPRYQGKWNGCPVWLAYMWPERRPPKTRIVVSNTWGLVFTSKDTWFPSQQVIYASFNWSRVLAQSITFLTALSKPCRSSRTTSVSSTSMRVREKLPATSFEATLCLIDVQRKCMIGTAQTHVRITPIRTLSRTWQRSQLKSCKSDFSGYK